MEAGDLSKKRVISEEELELKRLKKELQKAKLERDILKKSSEHFSQERQLSYVFCVRKQRVISC